MKKQLNLSRKALLTIEALCMEEENIINQERLFDPARLQEKLGLIYKLAHVGTKPSCKDSHKDWEKELDDCYESFVKIGMI